MLSATIQNLTEDVSVLERSCVYDISTRAHGLGAAWSGTPEAKASEDNLESLRPSPQN
jgi:hypothetical protein